MELHSVPINGKHEVVNVLAGLNLIAHRITWGASITSFPRERFKRWLVEDCPLKSRITRKAQARNHIFRASGITTRSPRESAWHDVKGFKPRTEKYPQGVCKLSLSLVLFLWWGRLNGFPIPPHRSFGVHQHSWMVTNDSRCPP